MYRVVLQAQKDFSIFFCFFVFFVFVFLFYRIEFEKFFFNDKYLEGITLE